MDMEPEPRPARGQRVVDMFMPACLCMSRSCTANQMSACTVNHAIQTLYLAHLDVHLGPEKNRGALGAVAFRAAAAAALLRRRVHGSLCT